MLLARPTWIAVDLGAIDHNIRRIRQRLSPSTELLAVVKAHGYGHGAVPVSKAALAAGARMLGVTCLDEALEIREAGITADVLMLGYTPPWQASTVVAQQVCVSAFDPELLESLATAARALGQPARVHLKVDTGMSRFGPLLKDFTALAQRAYALEGLEVEGVFSHFASADADDQSSALDQLQQFQEALRMLEAIDARPRWRHLANSAGAWRLPAAHFDMVRPGALMYGLDPTPASHIYKGFRPALSFHALVAQVKSIPTGAAVSYGGTWRAARPTRLAVLQVGYADGFRRTPDSWGHVLIHGQRAPLVGVVCMDLCMADVTDIPAVRPGDVATLLGRQGQEYIGPWDAARAAGTIGYEILTGLASRVPRVYTPAGAVQRDPATPPETGEPLRRGMEFG